MSPLSMCLHELIVDAGEDAGFKAYQGDSKTYKVFANPLIQPIRDFMKVIRSKNEFAASHSAAWGYSQASWRRMIMTQPPVSAQFFIFSSAAKDRLRYDRHLVINTGNTKTGDIVDLIDDDRKRVRTMYVPGAGQWSLLDPGLEGRCEDLEVAGAI